MKLTDELTKINHLKERLNEADLKHDSQIIMFRFLSEIERLGEERKIKSRKELAEIIGISGSYLTQLFRGTKPLNIETIAKFQKAFNIKFEIKASNVASSKVTYSLQDEDVLNKYVDSLFFSNMFDYQELSTLISKKDEKSNLGHKKYIHSA